MVCILDIHEKPKLNNPVLIEGLPGIGFIANIGALHLIRELKAALFADIFSDSFQDLAVTTDTGGALSPRSELYYHKNANGGRDLIIWYGNTQALTTTGQYELCGRVLNLAHELGCRFVITLGGFKKDEVKTPPEAYCAASDAETLNQALALRAKIMVGQIFGVAGLSVGLAKLHGMKGFAFLVETLGTHPDVTATRVALTAVNKHLNMNIDLSHIEVAAEETMKILASLGLMRGMPQERKREQRFRWEV